MGSPRRSQGTPRNAENRPRTWVPPIRATPTTQRGAVADATGPRRPPVHSPGPYTGGGRGEARTTPRAADETLALGTDEAATRPPSLSVGIGAGRGVGADEVIGLVERVLEDAGLSPGCVAELATVDAKAGEPGLLAAADRLNLPLRTFPADVLAAVEVPNPSDAARAAVGSPSVAEAAALTAAGGDGWLVVPKVRSLGTDGVAGMATAAVARRRAHGRLMTTGHGPGTGTEARTRETPARPESTYSKECQ